MGDCVANRNLCGAQRIQAFPTLRFFKDVHQYGIDYKQDRTVSAMVDFLKQKIELEKTMKDWHPRRKQRMLEIKEHPGCMISGHVLVNRVPGNFHMLLTTLVLELPWLKACKKRLQDTPSFSLYS